MRKPPTNEGARLLSEALPEHGDVKKLAEELGVSDGVVSRWACGDRKPRVEYREALETKFEIHWRAWDQELTATGDEPRAENGDAA